MINAAYRLKSAYKAHEVHSYRFLSRPDVVAWVADADSEVVMSRRWASHSVRHNKFEQERASARFI